MTSEFTKEMVFIDFESTGFEDSYPIEVGMVGSDGYSYNSYIKPTDLWLNYLVWNPEAEKIHNIKKETIIESGRSVQEVANEIAKAAENNSLFSDNGSFDDGWCNTLFDAAGIEKNFMIYDIAHLGICRNHFFQMKSIFFFLIENGTINSEEGFIKFILDNRDKDIIDALEETDQVRKYETTMKCHEALADAISCSAIVKSIHALYGDEYFNSN